MIIESPIIVAGASAETLFDSLRQPANLEEVLPTEQISEFEATNDSCSFKVTGGFTVVIQRVKEERPTLVRYASQ